MPRQNESPKSSLEKVERLIREAAGQIGLDTFLHEPHEITVPIADAFRIWPKLRPDLGIESIDQFLRYIKTGALTCTGDYGWVDPRFAFTQTAEVVDKNFLVFKLKLRKYEDLSVSS